MKDPRIEMIRKILEESNDEITETSKLNAIEDLLEEEISPSIVPEGYKKIAIRNDRFGMNIVYYSPDDKLFYVVINSKAAGPYTLDELKGLMANYKDVVEMKGFYYYIEDV